MDGEHLIVFFPDRVMAHAAIDALVDADFSDKAISMITPDSATTMDTPLPETGAHIEEEDFSAKMIEPVTALDNKTGLIEFIDIGPLLISGVLADKIEQANELSDLIDTGVADKRDFRKILGYLGVPLEDSNEYIRRIQAGETLLAVPAEGEVEELTDLFTDSEYGGVVMGEFPAKI